MHIHTYMHACIHTYIHIYMHRYIHAYICTPLFTEWFRYACSNTQECEFVWSTCPSGRHSYKGVDMRTHTRTNTFNARVVNHGWVTQRYSGYPGKLKTRPFHTTCNMTNVNMTASKQEYCAYGKQKRSVDEIEIKDYANPRNEPLLKQ